ncbi:gamma-type small acid-soluble spore protein [Halalkalibacter kiskunsagensis]|uniref:Small, acid-soluble spore protein gamma-type n=1 Tax=Halalkalibacter kiskunsagensis TaxID=1548599 RepID=A0ABV6KD89_9BACI
MNRQNQQGQPQASKTNAQEVRKQNAASAQGKYGTEFASETNAQEVRQQNAQSAARKQQNSSNQQQQ